MKAFIRFFFAMLAFCCFLSFHSCSNKPEIQSKIEENIHELIIESGSIDNDSLRVHYLDSLLSLSVYQSDQMVKAHYHLELGEILKDVNVDSAAFHIRESIALFGTPADSLLTSLLGQSYNTMGILLYRKEMLDSAIKAHQKSISLFEIADNAKGLAWNYNNLGVIYSSQNLQEEARANYQKSLEMAIKVKDTLGIGFNLLSVAGAYLKLGNGSEAIDKYFEAAEVFDQVGHANALAHTYTAIARTYTSLDREGAYKYALLADSIYQSLGRPFQLGNSARFLGENLVRVGRAEESLVKFREAIRYYNNSGYFYGLVVVHSEMHRSYMALNKTDSALIVMERAVELLDKYKIEKTELIETVNSNLALLYHRTGNDQKALEHAKISLEFLGKYKELETLVNVHTMLANIYKKRQNVNLAYDHLKAAYEFDREFKSKNENKTLAQSEARYTYQKEKQKLVFEQELKETALQSEVESQRFAKLTILLGLLVTFIFAFTIFMNFRRKKKLSEKLSSQNKQITALNEEMNKLGQFKEAMTSMIAHDLKNPLGVIMNSGSELPTTRNMASQMLVLINNMLDVNKLERAEVKLVKQDVLWQDLINQASLQVVSLLSAKNIQLNASSEGNDSVKVDIEMIVRVLVNFLTNAIKYSPYNSTISVSAVLQEGGLSVSIKDQGEGIPADRIPFIFDSFYQVDARKSGGVSSTGLGLTFCRLAINAHGSEIQVDSSPEQGTTFSFILPLASEGTVLESISDKFPSTEGIFVIPEKAKAYILSQIPRLRALELYEAYEIEQILETIRGEAKVDLWVNRVLDAAYSGNKDHYEELLTQMEV